MRFIIALFGLVTFGACASETNPVFLENLFFECGEEGAVIDPTKPVAFPADCKSELFRDDFSQNNDNWPTINEPDLVATIVDGRYRLSAIGNKSWYLMRVREALIGLANFDIEVDLQFKSGASTLLHGITWGGNGGLDNLYQIRLSATQQYVVEEMRNSEIVRTILPESTASAINSSSTNRIRIRYYEGVSYFFINDTFLGEADGLVPFGPEVGFNFRVDSTIEIDNVVIYGIQDL